LEESKSFIRIRATEAKTLEFSIHAVNFIQLCNHVTTSELSSYNLQWIYCVLRLVVVSDIRKQFQIQFQTLFNININTSDTYLLHQLYGSAHQLKPEEIIPT
jgi:hypothetical protein